MSNSPERAPVVSVVVPCYNLGRYLDEAVDSVLAQSFQNFEILVVDDGSTDEATRDHLETFTRPKTRVVRSENRGLPAAKNLGLTHTTGQYVSMLDADDRLDPVFLERSVDALDNDASLAFASHWFRTFGDEVWDWTPSSCDLLTLLDANTVNGAALVRREALDAVGGFDETMRDGCEDWDLWISLVERGYPGRILPEVLFHYRRRANSMSRVMMEGDRHPQLFRRLVEKHTESYRTHLGALLTRRERDMSQLRKELHALEIDHYRELAPELTKRRDDLSMLERKLEFQRRDEEHEAATKRALAEVAALRASWSWRLTFPLRRLADLAQRLVGRRR